ncbi:MULTISPECIES: cell division topological specificity factor MinE [unclassified Prochlorococcus]|uniref:cell division topological specificity factor MinE n=1 Tax=unclassified Prochlorococcus TaxID=2627481 RepID=UPI000533771B|nr:MULTISPECIES: cell division topological specificity factor MinE [unclassified Prochlorococcus]KGG16597.1 Cell division topological specificity factor MinE [Prochlorococcus sp. MIT 0602]KGG18431.1 Cell division topological specificity factor MinE [Prochlorococcus sp. MIT 0603]
MTLRDILNKLLGRQPASAAKARERLQLVLAHDRTDLSPDLLDKMRAEILDVVAKYVEIDLEGGEVSLETEDRMTALVANLPIKRTLSGQIKMKQQESNSESISKVSEEASS